MTMDLDYLNKHYDRLIAHRDAVIRLKALQSTILSAHQLDGLPSQQQDRERIERLALSLEEQQREIDCLSAGIERESKQIRKFTRTIADNRTKLIITLRFFVGCTWSEVAQILGGRETAETCKMCCYRFFSK